MKYYEKPIVSCVPHIHPKYPRNYRYCTGESIITPDKIRALIQQSTNDLQWMPFATHPEWDIGRIEYVRPWPNDTRVRSCYFYVIGLRQMFIDLANPILSIWDWHEKYKNNHFVMTVPVFADIRFPDESWYVSNVSSKVFRADPVAFSTTFYEMMLKHCYTLGSTWLLLFSLVALRKLPSQTLCSLLQQYNGNYVVPYESYMSYYYHGVGHPMVCDILELMSSSWFSPEVYREICGSIHETLNETSNGFELFYRNDRQYHIFHSTLKCIDDSPFHEILTELLSTKLASPQTTSVPWIYPLLSRIALCSKKEWGEWMGTANQVYRTLHKVYFQKRGTVGHFFYTTTVALSYLYYDVPKKRRRVIQLWNQMLSYIRGEGIPLTESFHKIILCFYQRKSQGTTFVSIPIRFLKSVPMEGSHAERLYTALKGIRAMDTEADRYVRYLDRRALTKLDCCRKMDSYLVGCLLQNYFKEHRAELFS